MSQEPTVPPAGQEPVAAVTPPAAEPKADPPKPPAGQEPKVFEEAYVKQLRDEAAAARVKVKEFEDRDKSDQQKLEERAAKAESGLTAAESKLLKFEVAAAKNIPLAHAHRLTGSTKEELETDADALVKALGEQQPPPDFAGGPRGSTAPAGGMDALIRQAAGQG